MRKAFLLSTTAVAVVYVTILLIQGMSDEVSIVRELAIQRVTVARLSSCAEAVREDLPRYLRREIEEEILKSAAVGQLPDRSNIKTEEWKKAVHAYLLSQSVQAEIQVKNMDFHRSDAPEGSLECTVSLRYELQDRSCGSGLQNHTEIRFVVPVRIYLMNDLTSGFRGTIVARIRRAFLGNIGTDYDAVRRIIAGTVREYERRCADKSFDFGASVAFDLVRDNETVRLHLSFEKVWITDMSPLAEILVRGKPTRVTFRPELTSVTLVFKRD